MYYSIETQSLSHSYSKGKVLLKRIDLQVPQGSIFGLLGNNGAGKTTILKLILGLLKMQSGSVSIFGKTFMPNRIELLKKIGSLIESPSYYAHLDARDNLKILQKAFHCKEERIDEVLQTVGLANAGKKKVSQFSLGMKQRLSIGFALLHEPQLLILDEPTNGLDPNGIIEIRNLLRSINAEFGTTIVISSHLLTEIEKLVSHLAIINEGQLLFQGTFESLKSKQKEQAIIKLETDDLAMTYELLVNNNLVPVIKEGMVCISQVDPLELSDIVKLLVSNDIRIFQVIKEALDLESTFIHMTKN